MIGYLYRTKNFPSIKALLTPTARTPSADELQLRRQEMDSLIKEMGN